MPQYLISMADRKVILRNFEGVISGYTEPEDKHSHCIQCGVCEKHSHIGITSLFGGDRVSIEPAGLHEERKRFRQPKE